MEVTRILPLLRLPRLLYHLDPRLGSRFILGFTQGFAQGFALKFTLGITLGFRRILSFYSISLKLHFVCVPLVWKYFLVCTVAVFMYLFLHNTGLEHKQRYKQACVENCAHHIDTHQQPRQAILIETRMLLNIF